jgi:hypothetical protein
MSQTTVAATAKAKTQAIYVPTAVGRLRVALTCDDNYPAEDGLGAASIRDIVEQRTFRVHERAGAGSTCTLIGYGSSSRLPLSTATRHTQNRRDYQCLRIIPSHPLTTFLATSWRVFCTIRGADTARIVNQPPIRSRKTQFTLCGRRFPPGSRAACRGQELGVGKVPCLD